MMALCYLDRNGEGLWPFTLAILVSIVLTSVENSTENSMIFGFKRLWFENVSAFLLLKLLIFARDITKMKNLPKFININEHSVNFVDISKHRHRMCTLTLSQKLALLLELTGVNLQASGSVAHWSNMVLKCKE